jgi:hypothetical protein
MQQKEYGKRIIEIKKNHRKLKEKKRMLNRDK